jgi:hypothetical protein
MTDASVTILLVVVFFAALGFVGLWQGGRRQRWRHPGAGPEEVCGGDAKTTLSSVDEKYSAIVDLFAVLLNPK